MPREPLAALLEHAARAEDWEGAVVRRCAWCRRVARADGTYADPRPIAPTTVVTDGMCPTCGADALARVRLRRATRSAALAA